jgi:hypothetical protein
MDCLAPLEKYFAHAPLARTLSRPGGNITGLLNATVIEQTARHGVRLFTPPAHGRAMAVCCHTAAISFIAPPLTWIASCAA